MKIAIYTSALEGWISGGIACVIETLNLLDSWGHDVCAFVDINSDKECSWIKNKFPIYDRKSSEFENYDGVLVSPFSPTAKDVADHKNCSDRLYWVHTNEGVFNDNDAAWRQRAIDSYSLPLKMFCTSHYIRIIMEQMYNRNVCGRLVAPGYDEGIFNTYNGKTVLSQNEDLVVSMWMRGGWVRGTDVAMEGINLAIKDGVPITVLPMYDGIKDRNLIAQSYRKSHIYLDASRLAGSPTPVVESMACGAMPICTSYGTTDYVLSGHNGFIVSTDDARAIADILIKMYENRPLLESIRNESISSVSNRTWTNMAENFIVAIEECIGRKDLMEERFNG